MPRVPITDLDDPRIAVFRHLKATNLTRHSGQFVVEGEKLFHDLRASPFPLASVLVTDRQEGRIAPYVPADVPFYVLPQAAMSQLVGFNFHQGVLASGHRRPWPDLDELVRLAGRRATLVVCPRIDNPENLGAIIRLGDVFGVAALVVGPRSPDPLSRRVLRVSMGTSLRLPVIAVETLGPMVERLRQVWGYERVATVTEPDAEPLSTFRRPDRLALYLGCEGTGLDPEWTEHSDRRVTIPMRPGAESLNLAVAAGILLYYLTQECP
jgi:tRNA G18 (ribose-2'-O)-methylase SpoU